MVRHAGARQAIALVALAAALSLSLSAPARADLLPHRPGEVIIKFHDGATTRDRDEILGELGVTRSQAVPGIGAELAKIAGTSVADALARYRSHPAVRFIEPNYLVKEDLRPDDPRFDEQWGMLNLGQTGGAPGADISAELAWHVTTGSRAVVVAVIDTGIDYTHPDLAANIWANPGEIADNGIDDDGNGFIDDVRGWDFINGDNDPLDDRGHGTHVAGTIGAVGDNGLGVAGVNWQVTLMPLKFLGSDGYGSIYDAINCIDYATSMNVRLMNNSWGGGGYSEAMRLAIERADRQGILFVAAAGNQSLNTDVYPHYPSSYNVANVIAVAATDHDDQLAGFSNYGETSVDLAAPGVAILSAVPGGWYAEKSGTSMAAPHVTGALALILAHFDTIDADSARALLLSRVDPVPALEGLVRNGGRLNAFLPIAEPDETAPAAIDDLRVESPNATRVDLVWTASGDDGQVGTAQRYEVRYSTSPIDESGFELAERASGAPRPSPAGAAQRMTVTGLDFATEYHFALKVVDELGNVSPISNAAQGSTLGPPDLAPATVGLQADLLTGGAASRVLTLRNDGDGEGIFDIFIEGSTLFSGGSAGQAEGGAGFPHDSATSLPQATTPYAPGDAVEVMTPAAAESVSSSGAGLDLLILGSGIDVGPIRNRLEEQPDIATVEVMSAVPGLTLETLLGYDAVLLAVNLPLADPAGLGNILADYVDTGSGLIMTLASMVTGWAPGGRLYDEGYFPFLLGSGPQGSSTLGSHDPSHPLMGGVTALWGDKLASLSLAPEAELVASWFNGEPLLATKGPNVVGVNVYLSGSDEWSGDFPRLLRNAAVWSARRAAWLAVEPRAGTVPEAGLLDLAVRFDAAGLDTGDYDAQIVIHSDDPVHPEIRVPAALHVTAAPDIDLSVDRLDFGDLYVQTSDELYIVVFNRGFRPLQVTRVASDHPAFTPDTTGFTVPPGGLHLVTVTFTPPAEGSFHGTIAIDSDDPDSRGLSIPLTGAGRFPPDIVLSPGSFEEDLFVGERISLPLSIQNAGGSDLTFRLVVRRELPASSGNDAFVFHEGFEDGDSDGWLDAGGSTESEVTGATAAAGSGHSVHAYGSPPTQTHFDGIFTQIDASQPSYISFWVRSGSAVTHDGYFTVRDGDGYLSLYLYARASGFFAVNPNSGGDASFAYLPHTWYQIEFRSIDWSAGTFDYYVDGKRIAGGIGFSNHFATHAARIDLYNFSVMSEAWWDEIHVSDEQPPLWIAASPWSGEIQAGGTHGVELQIDAMELNVGDHSAEIHVISNDPDEPERTLPIVLHVHEPPEAHVEPASLAVALPPRATFNARRLLQVSNTGLNDLAWRIEAEPYVSAVPAAGVISPGDSREVELTLSSSDLEPGEYLSTVRLVSNDPFNSPLEVPLAFHVSEVALEDLRIERMPRVEDPARTIQVLLQLPPGYAPEDVLVSTVSLWGEFFARSSPVIVDDRNLDGSPDLTLQFDRAALEKQVHGDGTIPVTLTGEVAEITWFTGTVFLRPRTPVVAPPAERNLHDWSELKRAGDSKD